MNIVAPQSRNVIYGLRCLCHPEEGFRYIGQSRKGVHHRLVKHRSLSRDAAPKWAVHKWIKKHGETKVVSDLLEAVDDPEDLNSAEEKWIRKYQTYAPLGLGGLNLTRGGDYAVMESEESRQKARDKNSGEQSWSKLTWEKVREIRALYPKGTHTVGEMATLYGVTSGAVSMVIRGHTWVDPDYVFQELTERVAKHHKLNRSAAKEIRRLFSEGLATRLELTSMFDVSEGAIGDIIYNRSYQDATYDPPLVTTPQGSRNARTRLSEEQVSEILLLIADGLSDQQISDSYPIGSSGVGQIRGGYTWKHIPRPHQVG